MATLETHLPPLFDAAQSRGPLARDALFRLGTTGDILTEQITDLEGKELACVGVAAESVLDALNVFEIALDASVEVTVTTSDHTD